MRRLFRVLLAAVLVCFTWPASAKDTFLPNLHIYTLDSGMMIFINEEKNSAMPHVEFASRAGYSHQTSSDAGFFELYYRLFLNSADKGFIKDNPISSALTADTVSFSCDVTPDMLAEAVRQLYQCAVEPTFTDADIQKVYKQMKEDIASYQKSATGFLNSAIESRMFPGEPWKQNFGINLETFSSYSMPQIKGFLESIRQSYYTPDNSILIITGNVDAQKTAQFVSDCFSGWKTAFSGSTKKNGSLHYTKQRKFVLSSPIFSREMTQIAIQYTEFSDAEAKTAARAFNLGDSPFHTLLMQDKSLGIRGEGYLSASCSSEAGTSRVILQGIMEAPFSFLDDGETADQEQIAKATPVSQAENFVQRTKEALALSKKQFDTARDKVAASLSMGSWGSKGLADAIVAFWAQRSYVKAENFYSTFLAYYDSIKKLERQAFAEKIDRSRPFVFVMVNDEVYKENEGAFKEQGYELVSESNAAWYQMEAYKLTKTTEKKNEAGKKDTFSPSAYSLYYIDNVKSLSSTKLSNGIPLVVKSTPGSQTVVTSIAISGGESASPRGKHFMRTLLINAFASCIQDEMIKMRDGGLLSGDVSIKAWTTEVTSYITMECMASELGRALTALTNAIVYGDIRPLSADRLISDQNYQTRLKTDALSWQLKSAAIRYIYSGSAYEDIFDISETEELSSTDFQSIILSYTQLLDASLYSLVIVGDTDAQQARELAESTIGVLRMQKEREVTFIPQPSYEPKTLDIALKHTYTSDLDPALAPKESPLLVPTQKYYDPMQFYFSAPAYGTQRELFNALLLELEKLTEEDLGEGYECRAEKATSIVNIGMIEAEKLLHRMSFINSFKAARNKLSSMLRSDEPQTREKAISDIRLLWNRIVMIQTQTNEGTARLIQDGILDGNKSLYLDSYIVMQNATADDFVKILDKYIPEDGFLRLFSQDSQN
ncbi:MAG: insulinase family protein [Treponema sp.]|nr:insulinase family protein [Treponema sp.]